jgi:uncharacterized protein YbaR (Trm112 family)
MWYGQRRGCFNEIEEDTMAVDQSLLEILACPKCKGEVALTQKKDGLVCNACRLIYPITDGIPVMLVEEANPLD